MAIHDLVKLFDQAKIRVVWDDEKEKYYFSVVDVVGVLTESADGRTYWKVLKHRLIKEGLEPVTICNQLKLVASDGKRRDTQRIIHDPSHPRYMELYHRWRAQLTDPKPYKQFAAFVRAVLVHES